VQREDVPLAPEPRLFGISVNPKNLTTWQWTTMTITLRLLGQPVTNVRVLVNGAGINASGSRTTRAVCG